MDTKEARFTVKQDSKCDLAAIKKVVIDAGFGVSSAKAHIHKATVVEAGGGKITLTLMGHDKRHIHDVAKDAKVTLDDKNAKLVDLKEGFSADVTLDDKSVVTKIEAKTKK